jgi:O-antigen/teichoic acid export membrane protein
MNAISKLAKGGAWLTLASAISKLTSVAVIPILARLLGPQGLGIYNIVFALSQSAQGFSSLGVDIAMQRNGAQHKTIGTESVGRLFGVGLTITCFVSAVTGLGVWLFREPLAKHWLGQPAVTPWLGLAAIVIILQPFGNVPLLFLSSLQEFRAYALRSALSIVFSGVITVLLAWQMGLSGALLGMVLAATVQIIWSYLIVKPVLKVREIRLRYDYFWQELQSILKLGFPYYLGNTLLGSLVGLPLMGLVSQYGGLEQLGYLRVAQSMSALIGFIPNAIAPATISYLSANAIDDNQYLKSVHLRSVGILLLVPTGLVCLILPNLINFLFGAAYQQTVFLSWLSLWISALTGITSVLVQYLVVAGKTVRVAWASLIGVTCLTLVAFLLVPRYGALGFIVAQAVSQTIGFLCVLEPSISGLTKKDISLLVKLMCISGLLFLCSLAISLFPVSYTLLNYSLVVAIIFLTFILLFNMILHGSEKLKVKKILSSLYK